jgi:hypothetical protein
MRQLLLVISVILCSACTHSGGANSGSVAPMHPSQCPNLSGQYSDTKFNRDSFVSKDSKGNLVITSGGFLSFPVDGAPHPIDDGVTGTGTCSGGKIIVVMKTSDKTTETVTISATANGFNVDSTIPQDSYSVVRTPVITNDPLQWIRIALGKKSLIGFKGLNEDGKDCYLAIMTDDSQKKPSYILSINEVTVELAIGTTAIDGNRIRYEEDTSNDGSLRNLVIVHLDGSNKPTEAQGYDLKHGYDCKNLAFDPGYPH